MRSSRGKPGHAFPLNGGAVRNISKDKIAAAFFDAFKTRIPEEELLEIASLLQSRIVDVDNPRKTFTVVEAERIENSASNLASALRDFPARTELFQSMRFRLNSGRLLDPHDLYGWLAVLKDIDTSVRYAPSHHYASTIKRIYFCCNNCKQSLPKNGGVKFLSFLTTLEECWQHLIFPPATDSRKEPRENYLRRILRGGD